MSISVIMSVYNAERYLKESIESILNQTYTDFEFLIVNDHSTDNSLTIVEKYANKDSRIKIINNEKNLGLTKSLNKAIELAKGKYIARMDADDISYHNRLQKQYEYLEKNQDIIVLGTCGYNINENGQVISERNVPIYNSDILNVITIVNPMIHPAVMFRKKQIIDIGMYNEKFKKCQDYELWFRCVEKGYKMENLKDRLIYYRVDSGYLAKKSWKYRKTDIKIRWNGYKKLNIPIYKRGGILVPIMLSIIPDKILNYTYKHLKRLDPREK